MTWDWLETWESREQRKINIVSSGTLFIKQTYKRTKISWTPDGAKKLLLREVKICKPCVPRAGSSESNKTKYFRHRLYDTVWFLPECSDYSLNACLMFSEGSESSWSHPDRWTDKQTDTLFPWAPVRAKKCSRIWLWILLSWTSQLLSEWLLVLLESNSRLHEQESSWWGKWQFGESSAYS